MIDACGFAERVPFVESVIVDPVGRAWVERLTIGDEPARVGLFAAG